MIRLKLTASSNNFLESTHQVSPLSINFSSQDSKEDGVACLIAWWITNSISLKSKADKPSDKTQSGPNKTAYRLAKIFAPSFGSTERSEEKSRSKNTSSLQARKTSWKRPWLMEKFKIHKNIIYCRVRLHLKKSVSDNTNQSYLIINKILDNLNENL